MSNPVATPLIEDTTPRRPLPSRFATGSSRHISALVAGAGIVVLAALAASVNFAVLQKLVTEGDAARTATDILASETTFRVGVASLYAVVALDVLVAWALQQVFRPVHAGISMLAAWFRLAYAAVLLVAVAQLAGIPDLLAARGGGAFTPAQVDAMALARTQSYTDIWMAGLLLFGVHLLLIGYLAYTSGQLPRALGVLLAVAGLGYVFDTMAAVLSSGSVFAVSSVTFLGEFLLAVWLLLRGHRLSTGHSPLDTSSTTASPA
jgi:hypothetical protein